jgi:RNA polymerase sigma factor for flagellar operon FliA
MISTAALDRPDRSVESLASYHNLVLYIFWKVSRNLPQWIERNDVMQEGWVGILQAADRYDAGRDVKFGSFAKRRVRGAMIDYVRSFDHVPKHLRAEGGKLTSARRNIEQDLGRRAAPEEVAMEAGLDLDAYYRLEAVLSRDSKAVFNDELEYPTDIAVTSSWPETVHEALREAIKDLSDREAKMLRLMYDEDKTVYQTGDVLGVSGSRITQMHARAILKLKWALREYAPNTPRKSVHPTSRLHK